MKKAVPCTPIHISVDEEELKEMVRSETEMQKKFKALCSGKDLSDPEVGMSIIKELFK